MQNEFIDEEIEIVVHPQNVDYTSRGKAMSKETLTTNQTTTFTKKCIVILIACLCVVGAKLFVFNDQPLIVTNQNERKLKSEYERIDATIAKMSPARMAKVLHFMTHESERTLSPEQLYAKRQLEEKLQARDIALDQAREEGKRREIYQLCKSPKLVHASLELDGKKGRDREESMVAQPAKPQDEVSATRDQLRDDETMKLLAEARKKGIQRTKELRAKENVRFNSAQAALDEAKRRRRGESKDVGKATNDVGQTTIDAVQASILQLCTNHHTEEERQAALRAKKFGF